MVLMEVAGSDDDIVVDVTIDTVWWLCCYIVMMIVRCIVILIVDHCIDDCDCDDVGIIGDDGDTCVD